jgi:hypothetical protein
VEGQGGDVRLVTFEFELGRGFGEEEILDVGILLAFFDGSLREIFLQIFDLFFEVVYFFLEREDALPLQLQFVAFGVHICEGNADLLSENFGCFGVFILNQVFEDVLVELGLL